MEQIRDIEIANLYILKQVLYNYVSCQNIDLRWSCRLLKTKKHIEDFDGFIASIIGGSLNCFMSELLVLITELYNKDGLNCANNEFRTFFNNIKKDFPDELKNMNASEFLKTLRNSIAHNSETIQNFRAISHKNYSVHIKRKGESVETDKVFTRDQLLKILQVYDSHKRIEKHFGFFNFYDNDTSVDSILKRYKKTGSFNDVLRYHNQKGEFQPMDKFQERAFYRYLQKNRKTIRNSGDFEYFIMRFTPNPDNKFNHYENKYHLTTSLYDLYANQGLTCSKFLKKLEKEDGRTSIPFIDAEYMESLIVSSIAFNIFSVRSASEIKLISDSVGLNLSEELLSRLRNSFIHGRYFYNYDNGFEIYDGSKSLSHITTINYDTILKIAEKVFKPHFDNYRKQKIQEIINSK